jgi:hypothetical protein
MLRFRAADVGTFGMGNGLACEPPSPLPSPRGRGSNAAVTRPIVKEDTEP